MTLGQAQWSGQGMHAVGGTLIAPAPADFADEAFLNFKKGVLAAVHGASLRGVVVDVSRVELLDMVMFTILADTARMAALLGAKTVFVGFQPGVVSALIDMDAPCDDIVSAPTLEDALIMLSPKPAAEPDPSDDPEGEEGGPTQDSADTPEEPA